MFRAMRLLLVLSWLLGALAWTGAGAASPGGVYLLKAKGTVNPVMASYIERGIKLAESHAAAVVVIQLDTPGGLASSMVDIVEDIMGSSVPVVVYVSPAGAWAGSAGVFIAMAAHVVAMAPGTMIGAAHPVSIGESGGSTSPVMEEKMVSAAAAQIRSIAHERGRNIDWAERAVRESASLEAPRAVEENVANFMAEDLNSLLAQLQGRQVRLLGGREVILDVQNAPRTEVGMSLVERFLFAISDPNVAYILLGLGMTGLFFELANPGAILPGVVGGISLLLALYSLSMLPVEWAGVFLIALAFVMFLAEIWVTSHGALAVGAIASLAFGSFLLMSRGGPLFSISPWLIVGFTGAISLFFIFIVGAVIQAHRRPATTGREGLIGRRAVVRSPLEPVGTVFLEGERWNAELEEGRAGEGEAVVVTRVESLKLWVTKLPAHQNKEEGK